MTENTDSNTKSERKVITKTMKTIRCCCGNVACLLAIVCYCLTLVMLFANDCSINGIVGVAGSVIFVISLVLALVAGRWWVVFALLVQFLLASACTCV